MTELADIDAPDEGSLETASVPELLAQAWRTRRSGRLQIAHGKSQRTIEVRDGAPISVDTPSGEDDFAQQLADARKISAADRLRVERLCEERGCPEASAVLALKLLDPPELYRALRRATRRRIAEAFEWQVGMYRWTDAVADGAGTAKPHDLLGLLQEELPRRWGTERLFGSLMVLQDVRGDVSSRYRRVAQKLAEAGPLAARAISQLDGSTPLGQILGDCAGDPVAAATLWTAVHTGVLRRREASAEPTDFERLEFEVEVDPRAGDRLGAAPDGTFAEIRTQDAKADAKATQMREEILSLRDRLGELDHYSALGLDEKARQADFKKAYFKAAKKYHPDALARLGLDDLKEDAAQVFARIAEAFETLSDADKKAAYDARGGEEAEIDTARLAQAETSFRKGEILARMGNFEGALEYLEPAVELWPEEPAYQAGLAWALYKQPKPDTARAAEHFEIALGQAPEDAQIHYRLGLVLRSHGDLQRASELIAKARSLDPSIDE